MSDPLLNYRDEFPILSTCTYLISNSLGAMPRGVYDKLNQFADSWASLGVRAWGTPAFDNPTWWNLKGAVGDKIAPLIGAPPSSVLVHENASIANSILLSALDLSAPRRSKVVVSDMDFPSDVYTLQAMLPEQFEIVTVRSHDGITLDTDELLDAIDEQTRLVSLSHVLFKSAYIVPVEAVVRKAHAVGAQVLLNGYHSVGIIPVDVSTLNVDFYIGGVLKWMCGGPGGVFMYVRPDLLPSLQPKITGWFAHAKPFAFQEQMELREDAYRLANGTPAIAALYSIQPGIEVITQVGVEAIRAKSMRQTRLIIELADQAGYEVVSPRLPSQRAGTVTLRPQEAYAVSRELIARGIVVDYREGAGIRIAPHFYNSDEEIHLTMQTMREILADGSWQKHAKNRDFVT
ncbi:MAG: aminotransferase class V-fold PLP-dependent enzyme [Chloroflexota bacterium]